MAKRKTIDFLIVYDHDARKQISLEEFRSTAQALKAYSEREEQYRDNPRLEVVLLGADSIEAIKVTHSKCTSTRQVPIMCHALWSAGVSSVAYGGLLCSKCQRSPPHLRARRASTRFSTV